MVKKKSHLQNVVARFKALQRISVQLVGLKSSRDLLDRIVRDAMDLLGCDAGSLFLVREADALSFEVGLNDSVNFEFRKIKIPLNRPGIATHTFMVGESLVLKDVYKLSNKRSGLAFDSSLDKKIGYRTRSVLAVPLKNSQGETIGVLQLLNKKNKLCEKWPTSSELMIAKMPHFDKEDLELIESFAAVAAASIENQGLYERIENIFESFVKASVVAIDARDPGTRGHSLRVAHLTVELARAIHESQDHDLKDICFSKAELKELLWAGYLHDFGKIAVRETTLQKEQKLTEIQRLHIERRMSDFMLTIERRGRDLPIGQNTELDETRKILESAWQSISDLSRPSVLDAEAGVRLENLQKLAFMNSSGSFEKLLSDEDVASLKIRRGCLTDEERKEIESHVTQSYEFLKHIPWGATLKRIPEIAYSHHELLDGSGYPRGLRGNEILLRSQIMTICDIFDALSASDRAYKAAVPIEKTIAILGSMVEEGKLNESFFRVFKEQRIWERVPVEAGTMQKSESENLEFEHKKAA